MDKWERGEYKNPYLLVFNKKEEIKFMAASKKADLLLFKAVAIISIILTLLFIIIDYQRIESNYSLVFTLRSIVVFVFALSYFFLTYRSISPPGLQMIIISLILFLTFTYYLLDAIAPMPYFFLPNTIVTIGFFGITISGLRFRNGMLIELFLFISFILYSSLISGNEHHQSQIPNIFTNMSLGVLTGYTLERVRRTAFLRNEKILSQNNVIRTKNNSLKNLISTKNKLISILSHDLRSPINSLKSLLEMMSSGDVTREEFEIYVKQITSRIELTENLIENLLLWAKAQVSGAYIKPFPFSLLELTSKNLELFKENANRKGIQLTISNEKDVVVYAHQESINMVIRNLLSNSLKFTPEGGRVVIDFKENGKYVEFHITDSGVGIPKSNLNKIFEYENFTTLGTNNEKGSGIGLAICRDFIVKNKGKIWVESVPDEGTTFKFKIPLFN